MKNRRNILTVAIWLTASAPTWMTLLYIGPETFYQTFSLGCAQVFFGAFAVATTMMLWEGS